MKKYTPKPIDTSSVEIPEDLRALSEKIAKNTHEVWAQARLEQGWTWGETRDDEKKTHPDLIPYEDLTETEKDYDRNTSNQTIKLILSLGYQITKK